ncbi:hypothetical protein C0Q70_21280 [Pomacea canaliculata]|uniref:RING-type domain-containing protein n=1 Tax=Pomacea canaliculata TaxID=400727 RepID=A0A2T7NC36_POMCA|nr:hypothetical protein C0Q70_21280 [Pomacea canaliculata]
MQLLAGMDATGATFSNDSSDPECPICLGPFTEPKILFCGHITCRVCLLTWIEAQDLLHVGCPLCRHPMLEMFAFARDDDDSRGVDSLPTHHVIRATARGKIEITPDMCSGCEDLLCRSRRSRLSRRSRHPDCPGQDAKNSEAHARAALKDLSDQVQTMLVTTDKLEKCLKDRAAELRGEMDEDKIEDFQQNFDLLMKPIDGQLRSVLLTHRQLLQSMGDSHQYVAIVFH